MDGERVRTQTFPIDITDDERMFGFVLATVPLSGKLVVANLGFGLCAVKVRDGVGATKYLVCDELLSPLHESARSLDELRDRFRAHGL